MSTYPWQPESSKTGNRAIGNLGVGLMNSLKTGRGVLGSAEFGKLRVNSRYHSQGLFKEDHEYDASC